MKIGVPKEIKTQEYRVGLTPESVMELTRAGHYVFVQNGAGLGLGATDKAIFGDADHVNAAGEFAGAHLMAEGFKARFRRLQLFFNHDGIAEEQRAGGGRGIGGAHVPIDHADQGLHDQTDDGRAEG